MLVFQNIVKKTNMTNITDIDKNDLANKNTCS
jgi:hypothetical protein